MSEKEGDAPYPVSHSICPDCKRKVLEETEQILNANNPKIQQTERRI